MCACVCVCVYQQSIVAFTARLCSPLVLWSLHTRKRHESQVESLEKRWLEQIAGLKKSEEALELERRVGPSWVAHSRNIVTLLLFASPAGGIFAADSRKRRQGRA